MTVKYKAALFAAALAAGPAANAEQYQYFCSGNWDNGSTVFDERHFVFYLDTVTGEYTIEGLTEGSFVRKESLFQGVETDGRGKSIRQFSLDSDSLKYEFSYFAEGLNATVGSRGSCQLNTMG